MANTSEDLWTKTAVTVEQPIGVVTPPDLPSSSTTAGVTGDLVWSVATTRTGAVLADGSTYDGTKPLYKKLWVALGSVGPQSAFVVPDLRERVPVGAGPNTALLANDGVTAANRHNTRHRHTPHVHSIFVQNPVAGSSNALRNDVTRTNQSNEALAADGGSGVSTDPLDGPGYVALNPFLLL